MSRLRKIIAKAQKLIKLNALRHKGLTSLTLYKSKIYFLRLSAVLFFKPFAPLRLKNFNPT